MSVDGTPPRQSSVLVTVTVKDLNDNDPLFTLTVYSATLKEELPSGQSIATVPLSPNRDSYVLSNQCFPTVGVRY